MGLFLVYVLTFVFLSVTDLVSGELRGLDGGVVVVGGGGEGEHVGSGHGKLVDAAFACTVEGSSLCQSNQVVLFRGSQWTTIDLDLETLPPLPPLAPLPPRAGTEKSGSASPRVEMLPLGQFSEGVWTEISCNWSLPEPFSKRINAAMNCPAVNGEEALGWGPLACRSSHAFFFSDGVYLQFDLAEGRVVSGPTEIRARFKMPYPFALGLDAAYPCPVPPLPSMTWTSQLGPQRSFPNCTSESQVIFVKGHMYLVYDLTTSTVVVPPHRPPKGFLTWPTEGHSEKIDALVALSRPSRPWHWGTTHHNPLNNRPSYSKAAMFLRNGQILLLMDSPPRPSHPDDRRGQLAVVQGETRVSLVKKLLLVEGVQSHHHHHHRHRHQRNEDISVKDVYWLGKHNGMFTRLVSAASAWFSEMHIRNQPPIFRRRRLKAVISTPSLNEESQQGHHQSSAGGRTLGLNDIGALAGAIVSVVTISVCLIMVCCICWKKRHHDDKKGKTLSRGSSFLSRGLLNFSAAISGSLTPAGGALTFGLCHDLELDPDALASATNGFNAANIISRGSNGMVYKGWLSGRPVAVKKLDKTTGQVGKGFYAEMEVVGRASHPNLVDFVGFVADGTHDVMLVLGHLPNGSLFDHLHGRASRSGHLSWERRMGIARGIAEGLCYLHTGSGMPLVHEDLKASNVLLDKNFSARLADFGLTRLRGTVGGGVAIGSGAPAGCAIKGNQGYTDPFCCCDTTDQPSTYSDVYAYGVLLLEIISGRRPLDLDLVGPDGCRGLIAWARPLIMDGLVDEIVDKRLRCKYAHQEVQYTSLVALACIDPDPKLRPDMPHVVAALQAFMDGRQWEPVPPFQPRNQYVVGPASSGLFPTWQCGVSTGGEDAPWYGTWGDSYMISGGQNAGSWDPNDARVGFGTNSAVPGMGTGYGTFDGGEQDGIAPGIVRAHEPQDCSSLRADPYGGCTTAAVGSGYVATRGWEGTFRSSPGGPDLGFYPCQDSREEPSASLGAIETGGSGSCDGGTSQDAMTPKIVQIPPGCHDFNVIAGLANNALGTGCVTTRGWAVTHQGSPPGGPGLGFIMPCEGLLHGPNGALGGVERGGCGTSDNGDQDGTTTMPGTPQPHGPRYGSGFREGAVGSPLWESEHAMARSWVGIHGGSPDRPGHGCMRCEGSPDCRHGELLASGQCRGVEHLASVNTVQVLGSEHAMARSWVGIHGGSPDRSGCGYMLCEGSPDCRHRELCLGQCRGGERLASSVNTVQRGNADRHSSGSPGCSMNQAARSNHSGQMGIDGGGQTEGWLRRHMAVDTNRLLGSGSPGVGSPVQSNLSGLGSGLGRPLEDDSESSVCLRVMQEGGMACEDNLVEVDGAADP